MRDRGRESEKGGQKGIESETETEKNRNRNKKQSCREIRC